MRTSPTQSMRNRRAWLLQGVQMIEGTIISVDQQFGLLTLEPDSGGEPITLAHEAFAFDVEAARALNLKALDKLQRNIEQLNREGAPLQRTTVRGEKYAGVDI